MSKKTVNLLSTFFYIGNFPVAPGTAASAAAVLIVMLLARHPLLWLICLATVTVVGVQVSGRMERLMKQKDPGCVVIDEVAGVLVSFLFLPLTPAVLLTGFFLFRAFDMFKIYPANKLEDMGGGVGIMMDDIMAGVYTNLVLQIAVRLAGLS